MKCDINIRERYDHAVACVSDSMIKNRLRVLVFLLKIDWPFIIHMKVIQVMDGLMPVCITIPRIKEKKL